MLLKKDIIQLSCTSATKTHAVFTEQASEVEPGSEATCITFFGVAADDFVVGRLYGFTIEYVGVAK